MIEYLMTNSLITDYLMTEYLMTNSLMTVDLFLTNSEMPSQSDDEVCCTQAVQRRS